MDQISRPYQVALVALLAFIAVWVVALRPKADTTPAPEPTAKALPNTATANGKAQTSLGKAVVGARKAAAQAGGGVVAPSAAPSAPTTSQPSAPASTSTPPLTPPPAPTIKRVSAQAGLPAPVRAALAHRRVLVLLFYNPRSPDDALARREVAATPRLKGRVAVFSAPIAKVSRYTAITSAVPVLGSPTVVVVARDRSARALTGLIDRDAVLQAVIRALTPAR